MLGAAVAFALGRALAATVPALAALEQRITVPARSRDRALMRGPHSYLGCKK